MRNLHDFHWQILYKIRNTYALGICINATEIGSNWPRTGYDWKMINFSTFNGRESLAVLWRKTLLKNQGINPHRWSYPCYECMLLDVLSVLYSFWKTIHEYFFSHKPMIFFTVANYISIDIFAFFANSFWYYFLLCAKLSINSKK